MSFNSVWTYCTYMYIYVDRCRELERRRWAWRHATAAKQARFTIITNRAYVPRPDRNTTEWPPDLKSSGTSQPASKAWFGPHIWRAHAYGPSNGNATSVSDDASLCKFADLSYHSYGICNALLSFHAKKIIDHWSICLSFCFLKMYGRFPPGYPPNYQGMPRPPYPYDQR